MKFSACIRIESDLAKALEIALFTFIDIYDNMFILEKESNIYTCYNVINLIPLLKEQDIEICGYTSYIKEI